MFTIKEENAETLEFTSKRAPEFPVTIVTVNALKLVLKASFSADEEKMKRLIQRASEVLEGNTDFVTDIILMAKRNFPKRKSLFFEVDEIPYTIAKHIAADGRFDDIGTQLRCDLSKIDSFGQLIEKNVEELEEA